MRTVSTALGLTAALAGATAVQEAQSFRGGNAVTTPAGARVEIDGTVENGVRLASGEIVIRGAVDGDANLIADHVILAPRARITRDL